MAQSIKLGNDTYLDASGVVVDSAGTTLALSSGTITVPSGITKVESALRKVGKIVYFRLSITGATATGIVQIATIPSGFWPSDNIRTKAVLGVQLYDAQDSCYAIIGTDGTVTVSKTSANGAVSITETYILA